MSKSRIALIMLGVIVLLTFIGLLSSHFSKEKCRRITCEMFLNLIAKPGQIINVLASDATPETLAILDKANVKYTIVQAKENKRGPQSMPYPWLHIKHPRIKMPFVVTVKYGFMIGHLAGQGGYINSFCLFGWVIFSWDDCAWFS